MERLDGINIFCIFSVRNTLTGLKQNLINTVSPTESAFLGYLLDKLGIGTEIVEELRGLRTAAVSPLDTEVPNEGKISTKWSIRQNVDLETIINAINN